MFNVYEMIKTVNDLVKYSGSYEIPHIIYKSDFEKNIFNFIENIVYYENMRTKAIMNMVRPIN